MKVVHGFFFFKTHVMLLRCCRTEQVSLINTRTLQEVWGFKSRFIGSEWKVQPSCESTVEQTSFCLKDEVSLPKYSGAAKRLQCYTYSFAVLKYYWKLSHWNLRFHLKVTGGQRVTADNCVSWSSSTCWRFKLRTQITAVGSANVSLSVISSYSHFHDGTQSGFYFFSCL